MSTTLTPLPKKTLATQYWVANYIKSLLTKPRSGILFVDKADPGKVYEVYVYDSSVYSIERDDIDARVLLEDLLGSEKLEVTASGGTD